MIRFIHFTTPLGFETNETNHSFHRVMADTQHLFQSGLPRNCFENTIFQQRLHAVQPSLTANRLGCFTVERHLADGVVHLHHFVYSLAATITGVITV